MVDFLFENNRKMDNSLRDVCYQYVLTVICDSLTKFTEIMDILNENDYVAVYLEKLNKCMDDIN